MYEKHVKFKRQIMLQRWHCARVLKRERALKLTAWSP